MPAKGSSKTIISYLDGYVDLKPFLDKNKDYRIGMKDEEEYRRQEKELQEFAKSLLVSSPVNAEVQTYTYHPEFIGEHFIFTRFGWRIRLKFVKPVSKQLQDEIKDSLASFREISKIDCNSFARIEIAEYKEAQ